MLNRSKTLLGQILADARHIDFVALNAARGLPTVRRSSRRGSTAAPEQIEAMRASFLESDHLGRATLIPRPVIADLGRWRPACGGLAGLVFPRPTDGGRLTKADWDNWRKRGFAKAAGAAGLLEWNSESETWVGDFRPYDLRHTCASLLIRAHVGPADVAAQLGTSLELVFRTYAHSIEAMRGRPSTSIAQAIWAARPVGDSGKPAGYEALAWPGRPKLG